MSKAEDRSPSSEIEQTKFWKTSPENEALGSEEGGGGKVGVEMVTEGSSPEESLTEAPEWSGAEQKAVEEEEGRVEEWKGALGKAQEASEVWYTRHDDPVDKA